MTEKTTRIFTFDPGMEDFHMPYDMLEPATLDPITLPALENDCFISPLANPFSLLPSIDARLQGLLKPVVNDMSVLKPRNFYALCTETFHALSQEAQTVSKTEVQESVDGLLSLLKENMTLMALFRNNLNLVQKI